MRVSKLIGDGEETVLQARPPRPRLGDELTRDQRAEIRLRALVILKNNKFLPRELAAVLGIKPRQLKNLNKAVRDRKTEFIRRAKHAECV